MQFYFVRHGLTHSNKSGTIQNAHDELTELGKKQAEYVARKLSLLSVDIIYSSPFVRAKNTAEIIQSHVGKEIIFSDLLRECTRPSELHHRSHYDSLTLEVNELIHQNRDNKDWRYSDEENYYDLIERAS